MLQKTQNAFAAHSLQCLFFEQGYIDELYEPISRDADLRDDFGLDSQELVALACAASELAIGTDEIDDAGLFTVDDVLDHLERHMNPWLGGAEQMVMQGSVTIPQSLEQVFAYIADCKDWPKHLGHVVAIDDLKRDGNAEKFRMTIRELTDGAEYSVDSSRLVNCDLHEIDFVQPRPPVGFKNHMGGWRFLEKGPNQTELVSFHQFSLDEDADLEESVILIRKHIRAALQTWANVGGR
ncbi:MAG: SRPBCC family protein [Paracoccaceae bacterium]